MCDLVSLLATCQEDTARLVSPGAAARLATWRRYEDDQAKLVSFVQRILHKGGRNGWKLEQEGGLSLERIVIEHCPQLFTEDDIHQAKRNLGIKN